MGLALPMSKFIHTCKSGGKKDRQVPHFEWLSKFRQVQVPTWKWVECFLAWSALRHNTSPAQQYLQQSLCSQSRNQGRALETRLRTRRSMETTTRPLLPSGITKFLSGDTSVLATSVSFPAGGTQPVEFNSDIVRRVNTELALRWDMWRPKVCDALWVARSQTTQFLEGPVGPGGLKGITNVHHLYRYA